MRTARRQPLEVPREAILRLSFASFTNVFAWMGFSTVAMKFAPVGEGALSSSRTTARSPRAGLACFIYMTQVPMGLRCLTWFETLRRLPPSSASTGMLLVPLIGVISAALILGEPLSLREVVAMVLTLGGVTLALQKA